MFVCCECCVLSGRDLCDKLITRPEESLPTVVRRCVWSRNLKNKEVMTRVGSQRHSKKKYYYYWVRVSYVPENWPVGRPPHILGHLKQLSSPKPANPSCWQQQNEEWNLGHDVLSLDKHPALRQFTQQNVGQWHCHNRNSTRQWGKSYLISWYSNQ